MQINFNQLKTGYVQKESIKEIDTGELNEYLRSQDVYNGENSVYIDNSSKGNNIDISADNIKQVQKQVNIIADKVSTLGLTKFKDLKSKFVNKPAVKDIYALDQIKKTMEAILYQIEKGSLSQENLKTQFGDRNFLCGAGTLTNLQNILLEMVMGTSDINSYIVNAKNQIIEQVITDMYKNGQFSEYGWIYRKLKTISEIHHISSLKNTIAKEYGLLVKTKKEDKYLHNISNNSKKKIQHELTKKLQSPEMIDTFIDHITNNILFSLPLFTKDISEQNAHKFANDFIEQIEKIGLKKANDQVINNATFFHYKNYSCEGLKSQDHLSAIIKDTVLLKLHEEKLVKIPEKKLDKIKLRLVIESSMDDGLANIVDEDIIKQIEDKAIHDSQFKEYFFGYIFSKNIPLDKDELGVDNIAKYAIENNQNKKESDNMRKIFLDDLIEKYCKMNNGQEKDNIKSKYQEIQNLGMEQEVKLLQLNNSSIGKFLKDKDAPKIIAQFKKNLDKDIMIDIDYHKCDIDLIEKIISIGEKSSKEQVKNYDKLSIKQKIIVAISSIIPPIGIGVYFLMKRKNKFQKKLIEEKCAITLSGLVDDLKLLDIDKKLKHNFDEIEPKLDKNLNQGDNVKKYLDNKNKRGGDIER